MCHKILARQQYQKLISILATCNCANILCGRRLHWQIAINNTIVETIHLQPQLPCFCAGCGRRSLRARRFQHQTSYYYNKREWRGESAHGWDQNRLSRDTIQSSGGSVGVNKWPLMQNLLHRLWLSNLGDVVDTINAECAYDACNYFVDDMTNSQIFLPPGAQIRFLFVRWKR